jgi:ribosomal protein S18 acetylase RimI-like enzyme
MPSRIRTARPDDHDDVISLWDAAGLTRPWNDPRKDLDRHAAVWPELLLVAEDDERLVGTVMAGYDGHRGWLYYLASAPDRRGEGIGRALLVEAERRLVELGCPKVQLMVRPGNEGVLGFYDALGYEKFDIAMTGKRLIADADRPARGTPA